MVNFPQFCLKDLDFFFFFFNLKVAQKHLSRPSKYLKAILVILKLKGILIILSFEGHFGHFVGFGLCFGYFRSLWVFRSSPSFDGVFQPFWMVGLCQ